MLVMTTVERAIQSPSAPSQRPPVRASRTEVPRDAHGTRPALARKRAPDGLDSLIAAAVLQRAGEDPAPVEPTDTQAPDLAANRATTALVQRARGALAVAPVVAANTAAQAISTWITNHPPPGQATNYSVGVAVNGDLYISRVGGVTATTAYVNGQLAPYILANQYEAGRDIFLAQRFATHTTSGNHAEMCIMAAVPSGTLTAIYCSAPHCAFCAEQMTKDNIARGAPVGGHDQQGWAHPFAPIFLGSQVSNNTQGQLTALKGLPLNPDQAQTQEAGLAWGLTPPVAGKFKAWL